MKTNLNEKTNLTELVFLLDRSGSMAGLEADTIGGYNSFIKKQKQEDGEANLSTVLFDDKYQLLHDRADIKSVQPLTEKEYFVRGSTALFDAVGISITSIAQRIKQTVESQRPSKVLFVITTDGMENASREFSASKIKEMIEHQKDKHKWEFLFLGANIDAISAARDIGISEDRAVKFCCDSQGVDLNYEVVSAAVASFRRCEKLSDDWKTQIEEDYKDRG